VVCATGGWARPIGRLGAYGRVDALALPVGGRALTMGGSTPSMEGMRSLHRGDPPHLSCGLDLSMVWIDHQHGWMHPVGRVDRVGRWCGSITSTGGCIRSVVWMGAALGGGEGLRREGSRDQRKRERSRVRGCDHSIDGMRSLHRWDAITPSMGCDHCIDGMPFLHRCNALTPSSGCLPSVEGTPSLHRGDAFPPSRGRLPSIEGTPSLHRGDAFPPSGMPSLHRVD
jgi:hypothetical protein